MKKTPFHIRRFDPWLRVAVVLYLLSTLLLVAGHQHHGLQGDDCSLCAAAHIPATVAPASAQPALPASTGDAPPIHDDQGWAYEFPGGTRSRAPPLV